MTTLPTIPCGETYLLLLPNDQVSAVLDDWMERNLECNLTLRRAKTRRHTVIETSAVLFAHRILKWYGCKKVHIRPPQSHQPQSTPTT